LRDTALPGDSSTKRRASIKDIARLARVSHSTVSRALHGSPLISRDTTERIRRIAQESGYRPSAAARSLVTSRTAAVGVVVTSISDPFAAEVLRGIEDAANDLGYSVFLANSDADAEREMKVVCSFEERRVDGILVTSSRVGSMYAEVLSSTHLPIVLLNNQHPGDFLHSVMIDNPSAASQATRHLLGLGHREIAYLGDRFGGQTDTERFDGYRSALELSGIAPNPAYIVSGDGKAEGGAQAVGRLLDLDRPPSAIFCYNDMTVLGALSTIRARGLAVPRDISLVGFDDLFFAAYLDPPLTTVRQPMRAMGRLAMETLCQLLAGSAMDHNIKVPGELIVRKSTAPPNERSRAAPGSP
jgi:DNA-binding LacI/PurR family transcriptional regulator